MQKSPQELNSIRNDLEQPKPKGQLLDVFSPGYTGFHRTGGPIGFFFILFGTLILIAHFFNYTMEYGLLIGIGSPLFGVIIIVVSIILVQKQKFFIYQDGFEFSGRLLGEKIEGRIFWKDITNIRVVTREAIQPRQMISGYQTILSKEIRIDTYTKKNLIIDLRNFSYQDANKILNTIVNMVNTTSDRHIEPSIIN